MSEEFSPLYRRASFWRFVLIWGPFATFLLIFFKDEFWLIVHYSLGILQKTPPEELAQFGSMEAFFQAGLNLGLNVAVFCSVYVLSLLVMAQFILPVHSVRERWQAWGALLSYWLGWHGPAVFVREGKLVAKVGEEDNINAGVALVDLRSALVLEQTYPWSAADDLPADEEHEAGETFGEYHAKRVSKSRLSLRLRKKAASPDDGNPMARVCGPGINFTAYGEKIRNVIDLRTQMRRESDVRAFTRDGIEVETKVFAGFSVSYAPEVITVGYVGGTALEHLYGLTIKEKSAGVVEITEKFSLDPDDAQEIHNFVTSGGLDKANVPAAPSTTPPASKSPFPFDERRIFAAAYGQAQRGSSLPKTQWDELPGLVAVEIFRSHIGQYTYDYLYLVDDPKRTPWMDEIKPAFSRKVRFQGLLSFKFVRFARSNHSASPLGLSLEPFAERHFGQPFRQSALEYSPVYPLQNMDCKPLREHGIVVIFAGFSELKPPPAIRAKMAEQWKAKLNLDIKTILARNDREAMQVINSARTQAQRDATYFLSNLLKREKHSKEALALLLFQALQAAATDEKNHKDLPPGVIVGMMQNLHRWLLVEWEESETKKKGPKGGGTPPPVADPGS